MTKMLFQVETVGGRRAFTLVELMIIIVILAILAALVVPQFSTATRLSRESALREDLRFLRTQILIYNAQHDGTPPGYPNGDSSASPTAEVFIEQMTGPSDDHGNVGTKADPTYRYGPYTHKMPTNPINDLATVQIVGDSFPAAADDSHGWIYQPTTLTIAADASGSDASGTAYIDY